MVGNKHSIIRLLKYKSSILRFSVLGFRRVFSENLADASGVSAAQVRKDFSIFGITGNRRGGYQIEELLNRLNAILGKDQIQNVVMIGAGNMGSALMKYKGFDKEGIRIIAAFDIDPDKIDFNAPIPVFPVEELKPFAVKHKIKLAIIAVTATFAQLGMDILADAGIKGVLNFAPVQLKAPADVFINNVDLLGELEKVIYFVSALDRKLGIEDPEAEDGDVGKGNFE